MLQAGLMFKTLGSWYHLGSRGFRAGPAQRAGEGRVPQALRAQAQQCGQGAGTVSPCGGYGGRHM